MTSRSGTRFELLDNDPVLATGPNPKIEEYAFTFGAPAGTTVRAIRLEALPHLENNGNVGRSPEGAFILSQIRLAKLAAGADGETATEVLIPFRDAANDFNQVNQHARTSLHPDVQSGGDQGWAVNHPVDGYRGHHEAIFELQEPLVAEQGTRFTVYLLHDLPWPRLNLGCMRISICDVEDAVAKYDNKNLDQLRRELAELMIQLTQPVRVPVIEELPEQQRRETYVNLRGNFQSKGEKVTAKFPEAFAIADDIPLNRREFEMFHDPETLTRIEQYELAFRMQVAVPEVMDISQEPQSILEAYGAEPGRASFANNCLLARRLIEQGVRFVQLFDWGWDLHGTAKHDDIHYQLVKKCHEADQPIGALLGDLKQRGMLDETLVICGGEFGRTPMVEARNGTLEFLGRDHHPDCFSVWLAGGGFRRGHVHGVTDELGYQVAEDGVSVKDFQATVLHALGLDPYRFSFLNQGLNQRLIGPANAPRIVKELLT
jgi:hypothetical protein